jgi:hypothetical protein
MGTRAFGAPCPLSPFRYLCCCHPEWSECQGSGPSFWKAHYRKWSDSHAHWAPAYVLTSCYKLYTLIFTTSRSEFDNIWYLGMETQTWKLTHAECGRSGFEPDLLGSNPLLCPLCSMPPCCALEWSSEASGSALWREKWGEKVGMAEACPRQEWHWISLEKPKGRHYLPPWWPCACRFPLQTCVREINSKSNHRSSAEGTFRLKIRAEAVALRGAKSACCLYL